MTLVKLTLPNFLPQHLRWDRGGTNVTHSIEIYPMSIQSVLYCTDCLDCGCTVVTIVTPLYCISCLCCSSFSYRVHSSYIPVCAEVTVGTVYFYICMVTRSRALTTTYSHIHLIKAILYWINLCKSHSVIGLPCLGAEGVQAACRSYLWKQTTGSETTNISLSYRQVQRCMKAHYGEGV